MEVEFCSARAKEDKVDKTRKETYADRKRKTGCAQWVEYSRREKYSKKVRIKMRESTIEKEVEKEESDVLS